MENQSETESMNQNDITKYQLDIAKEYLEQHESKNGDESTLECCIISDLLRIIKKSSEIEQALSKVIIENDGCSLCQSSYFEDTYLFCDKERNDDCNNHSDFKLDMDKLKKEYDLKD